MGSSMIPRSQIPHPGSSRFLTVFSAVLSACCSCHQYLSLDPNPHSPVICLLFSFYGLSYPSSQNTGRWLLSLLFLESCHRLLSWSQEHSSWKPTRWFRRKKCFLPKHDNPSLIWFPEPMAEGENPLPKLISYLHIFHTLATHT